MEFAYVDPLKAGFTALPGATGAMVPKMSRGGMKRTVDYAASVITYLEVRSCAQLILIAVQSYNILIIAHRTLPRARPDPLRNTFFLRFHRIGCGRETSATSRWCSQILPTSTRSAVLVQLLFSFSIA